MNFYFIPLFFSFTIYIGLFLVSRYVFDKYCPIIPIQNNWIPAIKNIIHTSVNSNMPKEHKAVMKPEVSDWFIENFTEENDIVLDCFMGLGTTGKSCLKYNRSFIGIEINENYYNIAKRDIENICNN